MEPKPISTYCRQQAEGWNTLPPSMVLAYPGREHLSCGFMREDGVHLSASVKDLGRLHVLHASIGPIRYYRPELTDEEHQEYLFEVAADVIETFFGERRFARQPDDPRRPEVKHYFAILEANE